MLYVLTGHPLSVQAQSPGGVAQGLTAWFKADAGLTLAGTAVTAWANQAANPNLANVTQNGGASALTDNMPLPFNFNPYIQFNNGCLSKEVLPGFESVIKSDAGSMSGIGTGSDQLATITANFTNSPCSANRCCSGMRTNSSQFGNTGVNWSTGVPANTGSANLWGLRASTAGIIQQENTFNGFRKTGSCGTRGNGAYRFAIGSFIGYYYGNGRIAEVVCHNRQLTAGEFNRLESYLAAKYGVTLGNNTEPRSYYASNNTIIWTGSNTHQNRVTVIGRDDTSGLIQKQSRSVHDGALVAMYQDNTYNGAFPPMNVNNATIFQRDTSFLTFGDNAADTTLSLCGPDDRWVRMPRTWKVQLTGIAGKTTLALQQADVSPQIGALLVSSDPAFTTGVTLIPLQSNGTELYASHQFAQGQYFSFGTLPMTINAVTGNPVCDGQNNGAIVLHPTGGAPPATYNWHTTPAQSTRDLTGLPAGAYTVTVTHGNGCTFDTTIMVKANPALWAGIAGMDDAICTSENGQVIAKGIGGTSPWTYSINGSPYGADATFRSLPPGIYLVSVKDQYGCEADTAVDLKREEYMLQIAADVQNAWCDGGGKGGHIKLEVRTGLVPYRYDWKEFPSVNEPKINNLPKGNYTATVTDQYGCTGNITLAIEENPCCYVGIPNAFSPNNDGTNDQFVPVFSSPVSGYILSVFNRWGERIFYTITPGRGWDGTRNGKAVDAGTYYYDITYVCEFEKKQVNRKSDLLLVR
ncbi:gliding motility-associated C-terminal domain-containing protein [Taibaiella chishuiensis]|nr:gliding motility-associated C-terminal domain-containing protein [Taibaiella chishuiensis]